MIRKAIIVVLTLGAVATSVLGVLHYTVASCELMDFRPPPGPSSRGFENPIWIRWSRGKVFIGHSHYLAPPATPWRRFVTEAVPFGFSMSVRRVPSTNSSVVYCRSGKVWAPAWAVPILFAAYPAIAFILSPSRRYRRRRLGLCLSCGYDLTGNESGVCPECGEAV